MDPISDIFRTMRVTAFGQHRLEATAPWGLLHEKQTEELYAQIGRLTTQVAWLKKKSGLDPQ